jgi:hypothetical protein
MEAVAVRKKLHMFIDEMPNYCLSSVESLLSYLAGEPVIENDLTDEEHALIEEGVKHYHEHPRRFCSA